METGIIKIEVIRKGRRCNVEVSTRNLHNFEIIGLLTQSLQGVLNSQHSKTNEKVSETE